MSTFRPIGKQPYRLTLGPYGFFWLELHGESKQLEAAASQTDSSPLVADSWERLLEGAGRYRLESVLLPEYLFETKMVRREGAAHPGDQDRGLDGTCRIRTRCWPWSRSNTKKVNPTRISFHWR